jgi:hypothetical protein
MGTGEKGRGIEMKAPAAIKAAKRAVMVVPSRARLFVERVTWCSIMGRRVTRFFPLVKRV